ncbi:unnamed protein product, partial [Rotaria sp. Silwood1]
GVVLALMINTNALALMALVSINA